MTDFRALCAELTDTLDYWLKNSNLTDSDARNLVEEASAALAQPGPQGPTDEDLIELIFNENDWNYISPETFLDIARSVLELR
jgi:hypothetical protein